MKTDLCSTEVAVCAISGQMKLFCCSQIVATPAMAPDQQKYSLRRCSSQAPSDGFCLSFKHGTKKILRAWIALLDISLFLKCARAVIIAFKPWGLL